MNYRMISKILSRVMGVLAALMLLPTVTALWYGESPASFLYTMGIAAALAVLLALPKLKRKDLYAREGFVSVALAWLLISLVALCPSCLPGRYPTMWTPFSRSSPALPPPAPPSLRMSRR